MLEVNLDTATTGDREHGAVGDLVVAVIKSLVAQLLSVGLLACRLASGQAAPVEAQVPQ
jgi:hypothetical protein